MLLSRGWVRLEVWRARAGERWMGAVGLEPAGATGGSAGSADLGARVTRRGARGRDGGQARGWASGFLPPPALVVYSAACPEPAGSSGSLLSSAQSRSIRWSACPPFP